MIVPMRRTTLRGVLEIDGAVHLHTGKVRDLYQNEAGDL